MTLPNVNTSTWRVPRRNGGVKGDSISADAYARVGLGKEMQPTDPKALKEDGVVSATTAVGGLPSVNTSDWRLPKKGEREEGCPKDKMAGHVGPPEKELHKWNKKKAPRDRRGKPMLYGGEKAEGALDEFGMGGGRMGAGTKLPKGYIHFPVGNTSIAFHPKHPTKDAYLKVGGTHGASSDPVQWEPMSPRKAQQYIGMLKKKHPEVFESDLSEDLRLSPASKKVISAFLDKKEASSKKLSTDGKTLDGNWMGGSRICSWKGGKIVCHDVGSRAAQTVQRAVKKMAPKNWLESDEAGNKYKKLQPFTVPLYRALEAGAKKIRGLPEIYVQATQRDHILMVTVGTKVFGSQFFIDVTNLHQGAIEVSSKRPRMSQTLTGKDPKKLGERAAGVILKALSRSRTESKGETPMDEELRMLRQLAGLEEKEHIEYALGTPHRRMPEDAPEAPTARDMLQEDIRGRFGKKAEPQKPENRLPEDIQRLAGIQESSGLPFGAGDATAPRRGLGHGILDGGTEPGKDYVDRVLDESQWFFKDFGDLSLGAFDPLGEAPGGRAAPWRGSADVPAKTPIVRKGKSHGYIGDHEPPESKGHVDVGPSEIDYDKDDPDEDEPDHEPDLDEPEDEEGDEELEGILKRVGGGLKRAGGRMRHGTKQSRSALDRLKRKFIKKHGIKTKRFGGDDD
jgi:hypothetical protein